MVDIGRQGTRGRPRDFGGGGTWTRGVEGGWVNIYPPPQTTQPSPPFLVNNNHSHQAANAPGKPMSPPTPIDEASPRAATPPVRSHQPGAAHTLPLPPHSTQERAPHRWRAAKNFPSRAGCSLRRFLPGFLTSVTLTTLHRLQEVNRLRHHPHLLFQPSLTLFQRSNVCK